MINNALTRLRAPEGAATAPPKRALYLDALRGYAILTMVLSSEIPEKGLPDWMYHAQTPPPAHVFNGTIPGITWVDLVFPFFLFALGAAIPLALSRRLDSIAAVFKRGLLLAAFAIVVEHVRPDQMAAEPGLKENLLGLLAFPLLFLAYARFPERWSASRRRALAAAGWIGLVALLSRLRYPGGGGFAVQRSDIILVLLANAAFFGSWAWLATRQSILARLGLLGALMALRLAPEGCWLRWLFDHPPLGWIFQWDYLQYLFIVIPGTIVGDRILAWMKESEPSAPAWSRERRLALAGLLLLAIPIHLIGLKARWVLGTTIGAGALCAGAAALTSAPRSQAERLMRDLFVWGAYWLMLGLLFEPFEGGIKKDPATMSFFFVAAGLALFMLVAFTALDEALARSRWGRLLIENGQNPMLAYVGMDTLVRPILEGTGLSTLLERLTPTPWLGALGGLLTTLLLAAIVARFTRRKLFWRT